MHMHLVNGVQGYVMDGYPSNMRQAELLEGALTGLDLAAERALIASASRLAPPRPATLPDLNRSLPSGLCFDSCRFSHVSCKGMIAASCGWFVLLMHD